MFVVLGRVRVPPLNNRMSSDMSGCQNSKAMANISFMIEIVSQSKRAGLASIFQSIVSRMYSSQTFMCLLSGLLLCRDSLLAVILIAAFEVKV